MVIENKPPYEELRGFKATYHLGKGTSREHREVIILGNGNDSAGIFEEYFRTNYDDNMPHCLESITKISVICKKSVEE